jgi:hypothetical protein
MQNTLFPGLPYTKADILLPDFHGAPLFAESLVTKKGSIKYIFVKAKELARREIE